MKENRQFERVNYLKTGFLHHKDVKYKCRLDNISKNGALVSLIMKPDGMLNPDDQCFLMLYQEDKETHYQKLDARIVRFESNVAALVFTGLETEANSVLESLVQKELQFSNGGAKLIDFGREIAAHKGIVLTDVYFDQGELNKEREMHILRFSAGEHAISMHLHREEIEAFDARNNVEQIRGKISHAIERLI